jgi:threonine dehydrogenase-like Zn-dependent dehydrogenase
LPEQEEVSMRAVTIHGPRDVRVEDRPDPELRAPGDAIVRVRVACVCGSDLWTYRGIRSVPPGRPIGHELVGVVERVGTEVSSVRPGQTVIAPFCLSDGTCQECRAGFPSSCENGSFWASEDADGELLDGAQGEYVRVPLADRNLVAVPEDADDALLPDLLTLSDVLCTGYHAAVSAGVGPGTRVVVVGDGAVGLSAVLSARILGASRIVAMSRHRDRADLAREFGATDVLPQRGEEAVPALRALLDGERAEAALECVGTQESMDEAIGLVRGGGRVGFVGVPAGGSVIPVRRLFGTNVTIGGGMAPVLTDLPLLLPLVLSGRIHPGRVFTASFPLERAADAYAAMDRREAIKSLLVVS